MKKHYTALLAAFIITLFIGGGMLLESVSALVNPNGLPVASSPAEVTATAQYQSAEQAQIDQLQKLVADYQAREAQYQAELASAGQQLQQANSQVQQYQMILMALQSRGLITVTSDGRIFVNE